MNTHTQKWIWSLGIITALLLTSNVFAESDKREGFDNQERKAKWEQKRMEMQEKLGLSEEQQQQLKAHREKFRSENKDSREQARDLKQQLKAELRKNDVNREEVMRIHNQIKALKSEADDRRLEGILEVREILTPEQFTKFQELKGEHGKKKGSYGDRMKKDHRGDTENGSHDK